MGKNEGRVTSQKQLNALIDSTGQPDFDVEFYRTYYNDLSKFHVRKLVEHYNKWGRNECRVTSQKQLNALIDSTRQPDFDLEFYRTYHLFEDYARNNFEVHFMNFEDLHNEKILVEKSKELQVSLQWKV
jgi:hypothetical protein